MKKFLRIFHLLVEWPSLLGFLGLSLSLLSQAAVAQDQSIIFGRDIAPVLVANCLPCHDDSMKRAGLSMASMAKLLAGGESGPAIARGKGNESLLIQKLRGEDQPQMPLRQRPLTEPTIDRIARWIDAGGRLDDGQTSDQPLSDLAWSREKIARERRKSFSSEKLKEAEQEEIARLMAEVRPNRKTDDLKTVLGSDHFLMIGLADGTTAKQLLETLEKSRTDFTETFRPGPDHPLLSSGRCFVLVFEKRAEFVEFARINGLETQATQMSTLGRLSSEWPVLALHAAPESLLISKQTANEKATTVKARGRTSRSRSVEVDLPQNILGLGVQALTRAALDEFPKAPAWFKTGYATLKAAEVDSNKSYYQGLVSEARTEGPLSVSGDWPNRSAKLLKDQLAPTLTTAMGYSLMDWLQTTQPRKLPDFARAAVDGDSVWNQALKTLWNVDQTQFLANWTNALLRGSSSSPRRKR